MLEEAIGYLAHQNEVIASSVHAMPRLSTSEGAPTGDLTRAFQIVQSRGQEMRDPRFLQRLWNRVGDLSPRLQQGFLPLSLRGQPGIRIINTEESWTDKDTPQFRWAVAALQREFRVPLAARSLHVDFDAVTNPWKLHPDGRDYLNDLRAHGHAALTNRLVRRDRPQVDRWLLAAFRRYGVSTRSRRVKEQAGTPTTAAHRAVRRPLHSRKLRRFD
jgi:hypothetical protein